MHIPMRNVELDGLIFINREKLAILFHFRALQKVPLSCKERLIKRIIRKIIIKEVYLLKKIKN
jgi:hypothetical protein